MSNAFNQAVDRIGSGSVKWDSQSDAFGKNGLLPFFIADSDYPTAPELLEAIIARAKRDGLGYTQADESYFDAVSSWFRTNHGWSVENSWIVPLSGVVSAMSYAIMAFTRKNDPVVLQSPVYSPFYTIIEACGRRVVENKLLCEGGEYRIDFSDLESKFRQGARMMLFCNPHNPVGRVWSPEEVRQVAALCSRYDMLLISDEIHCDLALFGNVHTSSGTADCVKDNLIVCTSPGKTFNMAGVQCANIIVPGRELRLRYRSWLEGRYIFAPNVFALEGCKAAYTKGGDWAREQIAHLEENARYVYDYFKSHIQMARLARLEGTFLMWIDLTGFGKSGEALVSGFVEKGVAVSRGEAFGKDYDGFIRLNIACPRAQLAAGLAGIHAALDKI